MLLGASACEHWHSLIDEKACIQSVTPQSTHKQEGTAPTSQATAGKSKRLPAASIMTVQAPGHPHFPPEPGSGILILWHTNAKACPGAVCRGCCMANCRGLCLPNPTQQCPHPVAVCCFQHASIFCQFQLGFDMSCSHSASLAADYASIKLGALQGLLPLHHHAAELPGGRLHPA